MKTKISSPAKKQSGLLFGLDIAQIYAISLEECLAAELMHSPYNLDTREARRCAKMIMPIIIACQHKTKRKKPK